MSQREGLYLGTLQDVGRPGDPSQDWAPGRNVVVDLPIPGSSVPLTVRVAVGPAPGIFVTFHGAVNRTQRAIPVFDMGGVGHLPFTTVAISDPTLSLNDELINAWYLGGRDLPVQAAIRTLIRDLGSWSGGQRVVMLGGSGGGFAALLYSGQSPGSIAIAINPQTNAVAARGAQWRRYVTACWQDRYPVELLGEVNLASMYALGTRNLAIYLQNSTDRFHMVNHLAPFLSSVGEENMKRILISAIPWHDDGHHRPPLPHITRWALAAMASTDELSAGKVRQLFETLETTNSQRSVLERILTDGLDLL